MDGADADVADADGAELDEHGRPEPPAAAGEAATLLGFLEFHRATLAWKCEGLDAAGLATTVGASSMTLGGLLVVSFGYDAAFLTLAGIAALGAVLFWALMPETRPGLELGARAVPHAAA